MTFSNVNIFNSSVNVLRTTQNGGADRIQKGGSFSPSTFEAVALMRSDLDNQWESAYIIKYQATMQNRLNVLKQQLTNAYKAILDVSSVQQVRENGTNQSNTALTDVYGNMIKDSDAGDGVNEAFRGLQYFEDQNGLDYFDSYGGSAADGVPSYYIKDNLTQYKDGKAYDAVSGALITGTNNQYTQGSYEMRKLYVNGPALQIVNSMKVTMRTEEVPPKQTDPGLIGDLFSTRPFIGGEKVAEYSADVNSGGYWSTLNYLYNFAPRELKYQYPTAYSTTTEETGTKQLDNNNKQALLFDKKIVDGRDVATSNGSSVGENGAIPTYDADNNLPPGGARVKWSSSNGSDGYITEKSASFNIPDDAEGKAKVDSIDERYITRRNVDNDGQFGSLTTTYSRADSIVKSNFDLAAADGRTITEYGTEEFSGSSTQDRVKWTYQHNGKGAADIGNYVSSMNNGTNTSNDSAGRDGDIDDNDVHTVRAAFLNHYIVQTQTVELNSSQDSFGMVKALGYGVNAAKVSDGSSKDGTYTLLRSTGIDGSADHVANDANKNKVIEPGEDNQEKLLLAGSGKVAKNFDGTFVARQYQIQSFNGQNISTESANVNISSANATDPIVLAEYEGFKRAETMTKGMATDYFSDATKTPLSESAAKALVTKLQTEINASTMVDTDWHYSEYTSKFTDTTPKDSISFKQINQVNFISSNNSTGTADVSYQKWERDATTGAVIKEGIVDDNNNFNNVTIGYRQTFNLKSGDFQTAVYSPPTNKDIYIDGPTFVPKDVFIEIDANNLAGDTSALPMDLVVNGKVVPPLSTDANGARRYNLKGFLQEGDNVIAAQVDYTHAYNISPNAVVENSFKLVASATGNDKLTNSWLNGKISTDKTKNADVIMDSTAQKSITGQPMSTWQSKLMVNRITPDYFNSIYSVANGYDKDPDNATTPANGAYINPTTGAGVNWASDKAYQQYMSSILGFGSVLTSTKVKDTNTFATLLTDALNKKEYQDIYNLGMLNTNLGKTMTIKAQVSAPTGGTIAATLDIRYDPVNNKFILVQNKFDAYGGK